MEGGADGWSSPHWSRHRERDSGRGGGYASGRSGPRENFNRSYNQFGDRQQQGHNQHRGSYNHRGGHQGRQYGNFGQQREGFSGHHADQQQQQHPIYPHHEQREQHPHAGFRGPGPGSNFDAADGRGPGFMAYGHEHMMAMPPQHLPPDFWGAAAHYPHPQVVGPGLHAPYTRLAGAREQPPQYPIPQPYVQHQLAAGHQGAGMVVGTGPTVGGGAVMHAGPVYHPPNAARPPQQAASWASGRSAPRNLDAGRGGGGGPGRGGGGGAGGSSAARNAPRAPHVPQPLVPSVDSRAEPVNSGMNSLGRPRQQPSSTINNVQSARGPPAETAQAPVAGNNPKPGTGAVDAASGRSADSSSAALPAVTAVAANTAPVAAAEKTEFAAQNNDIKAEAERSASAGQRDPAIPASSADSAVASTSSSTRRKDQSFCSKTLSESAAAPGVGGAPATSTAPSGSQANRSATAEASAAPASPVIPSPVPPASPQREASGTGPGTSQQQPATEKLATSAGGSAWGQRPATALFAGAGAPAGGHGPARKAGGLAPHAATPPQGSSGGSASGVGSAAAAAGPPPTAGGATGPTTSAGPHHAAQASASAAIAPPPRLQNRPAPVQTGAAQHPRSPPPGFGASNVASVSPTGAGSPPSGHVTASPKLHAQPQQQPQLSPRASAGGDVLEAAARSPVRPAGSQQLAPMAAAPGGAPASPIAPDTGDASKGCRNWASVAATRGSSGGVSASAPSRRQRSEGGSSSADALAAAAATTPAGNHPPGFAPWHLAASAPAPAAVPATTSDFLKKAADPPDGTKTTFPAQTQMAVAQAAAAKDPGPPAVAGSRAATGAPVQTAQNSAAAEGGPAVTAAAATPAHCIRPHPVAALPAAAPVSMVAAASAVAAAATALKPTPRDDSTAAAAAAAAAAAVALTGAPGRGQASAVNGAAGAQSPGVTSAACPAAEASVSWTSNKDTADGQRVPTVTAAGGRPVVVSPGNAVPGPVTGAAPATAGPGPMAVAAIDPTPAGAHVGRTQQATAEARQKDATASGVGSAPRADGSEAGPAADAAPKPADVAAEPVPEPAPKPSANADAATAEQPASASAAEPVEVPLAEPAPVRAPPQPKSWAAMAASAQSAPGQTRRAQGPQSAGSAAWCRSPGNQDRSVAGRGLRSAAAAHRDVPSQPPVDMFQPLTAAPAVAAAAGGHVAAPALSKTAHDAAGLSATKPFATAISPAQPTPASPLSPADPATDVPPPLSAPTPAKVKVQATAEGATAGALSSSPHQHAATSAESSGGGTEARADREAAALLPREGTADDEWHPVTTRHKAGKGARGADLPQAHTGLSAGPAAGSGAGRGRGRHGDAAAAMAGPHQRAAGVPGHHPQPGGRGRGAAGQQPQHGFQPPATGAKARGPPATASAATETAAPGGSLSAKAGVPSANVDRQAGGGGAAEPASAAAPEAAPSTGVAEAAAGAESSALADNNAAGVPAAAAATAEAASAAPAFMEAPTTEEAKAEVGAMAPFACAATAADGASAEADQADVPLKTLPLQPQPQQQLQQQSARAPGDGMGKTVAPAAAQEAPKRAVAEEVEEEEEESAASIPAGNNPWDLLGAAGEDGEVAAAAGAAAAGAAAAITAVTTAAAAAGSSEADLMGALRQLLTPVAAEQLLAAGRLQQQAGGLRIQPRGLANTGNTCFINSTMQALLGCAPFAAVLSQLPAVMPLLERSRSPTLYGLAEFSAQLAAPQSGAAASGESAAAGREESHAGEDDGWAEVPSGRGKKGSSRRSTSAYPAHHGHSHAHAVTTAAGPAPAAAAAAAASTGAATAAASMAALLSGKPLVPSMLNPIVAAFNPRISIAAATPPAAGGSAKPSMVQVLSKGAGGRSGAALVEQQEQQDAQEFFQFLVNRAHEEVVALRKAHGLEESPAAGAAAAGADGGDGEEWAQVGRKNKATVTRQVGTPADDASSRSPVSAIFSGSLKSTVRFQPPHAHFKPSATIEAFNMLHLDIAGEGVATLEDALRQHSVPESIEYKPDGATQMLPAKKDVRVYRLPECLVLHLKRFTYTAAGGGGYQKLHKAVAFGCSLRLEGKVLAEDCPDRANPEYRLFATVIHHGRSIAGGHYTADVLQPDGRWLRFNDAEVSLVPESLVLVERPYLLFYQRLPPPQQR